MARTCLFCESNGPFSSEHIIPESLGNDDLILEKDVCTSCNNHFSKVENFVLAKTAFAFWRVFLGIRTKKGALPTVDLSQPETEKGLFRSRHPRHTDGVGFSAHEDGSTSVEIDDPSVIRRKLNKTRGRYEFVMTPNVLFHLGRFLLKIGIEIICNIDPDFARSRLFQKSRRYARNGSSRELWPIFYFSSGTLQELRKIRESSGEIFEDVECYSYDLLECAEKYIIFRLKIGTDNWVVCLNEQYPTPDIKAAFPTQELELVWYSADEMHYSR